MGIHLKQVTVLDADGRIINEVGTPSISTDGANKGYVDGEVSTPTLDDKLQNPSATSGDESTTGLTISNTPANDSHVLVFVNGASVEVGDGVKTVDCYFSSDGGTTARTIANITSGDTLYWNGVIAGFDLAATDVVEFDYNEKGTGGLVAGSSADYVDTDSPVTLTATSEFTNYCDVTSGDIEFDLPALATIPEGTKFDFKIVAGANSVILDPNSTENIEGASTSFSFSGALTAITIRARTTGSNTGWWVVGA